MSTREEMIAHGRTVEEIADELGADSLAYLSMEGVYEAIGTPPEDHCDACFSGPLPARRPRGRNGKFALEHIAVVPATLRAQLSRCREQRALAAGGPRRASARQFEAEPDDRQRGEQDRGLERVQARASAGGRR